MKIARLFSLAAVSFALASATTACSWFQDDSEEHISRFYQPDDGITSRSAAEKGGGAPIPPAATTESCMRTSAPGSRASRSSLSISCSTRT